MTYHERCIGMIGTRALVLFTMTLYLLAGCAAVAQISIEDHRVEARIDERISIVPPIKKTRAMLGMVRHPDGTIFLNTQRQGLYKSVDEGRTWTPSPVTLTKHKIDGLGVSSDGKLWLLHQYHTTELYVSNSADVGVTWTTVPVLFQDMAPGGSQRPYWTAEQDYNSFVEGPDGSMMTAVELRYSNEKMADYQAEDQSAPGMHSTMIRTTDGGKTWGDPTSVHQYVAETSLAAVRLGAPAHIYLDAWPREPYGGHIDRIWPTADRQKATVEVRIAFDALDERLRPEMGVRVVFLEGEPEAGERAASVPVVMVDARALVRVEGRAGVFIVDRGTALFRAISASAERLGRVVVEEGLEGGETVVLAPPAALSDGDRIRVKKEQE